MQKHWKYTLLGLLFLLASCTESPERIHIKLDTMLQSDLTFLVAEVQKKSGKDAILEEPYFEIKDLRFFQGDTARMYGAYAEVDFHFLKGVKMMEKRKYRYDARYSFWDRYYKKLHHIEIRPDSSKSQ